MLFDHGTLGTFGTVPAPWRPGTRCESQQVQQALRASSCPSYFLVHTDLRRFITESTAILSCDYVPLNVHYRTWNLVISRSFAASHNGEPYVICLFSLCESQMPDESHNPGFAALAARLGRGSPAGMALSLLYNLNRGKDFGNYFSLQNKRATEGRAARPARPPAEG